MPMSAYRELHYTSAPAFEYNYFLFFQGGVYAVSWSADSKQLMSASGDKTVKVHTP